MTSGHESKSIVNHSEWLSATCQNRWLTLMGKGGHLADGYRFISNIAQHIISCGKEVLYIFNGLHNCYLIAMICAIVFFCHQSLTAHYTVQRFAPNRVDSAAACFIKFVLQLLVLNFHSRYPLSCFIQTCPNLQRRMSLSFQMSTSSSPGTKGQC